MNNESLTTAGLATGFTVIAGILYKAINHKRVRSNCCGKKIVASIDIEETTPPQGHAFERDNNKETIITEEEIKEIQNKLKKLEVLQKEKEKEKENIIVNPMRPYLNTNIPKLDI